MVELLERKGTSATLVGLVEPEVVEPKRGLEEPLPKVSGDYIAREIQRRLYEPKIDPKQYVNPKAE